MAEENTNPVKESLLAKEARLLEEENKKLEEENKDKDRYLKAKEKNEELKKERILLNNKTGVSIDMGNLLKNKGVLLIIMGIVGSIVILLVMKGC